MRTPVDKQAAMFLSRKRRCESIQEAVESTVNELMKGKLNEHIAEVFSGSFGPSPWLTFKVAIRQDSKEPGKFVYTCHTNVHHEIGEPVRLFGLNP